MNSFLELVSLFFISSFFTEIGHQSAECIKRENKLFFTDKMLRNCVRFVRTLFWPLFTVIFSFSTCSGMFQDIDSCSFQSVCLSVHFDCHLCTIRIIHAGTKLLEITRHDRCFDFKAVNRVRLNFCLLSNSRPRSARRDSNFRFERLKWPTCNQNAESIVCWRFFR